MPETMTIHTPIHRDSRPAPDARGGHKAPEETDTDGASFENPTLSHPTPGDDPGVGHITIEANPGGHTNKIRGGWEQEANRLDPHR